jgi:hypothetical protein
VPIGEAQSGDRRPTFFCATDDLPAAAADGDVGDVLSVGGTDYRVIELQDDGTGFTLVVLGR